MRKNDNNFSLKVKKNRNVKFSDKLVLLLIATVGQIEVFENRYGPALPRMAALPNFSL